MAFKVVDCDNIRESFASSGTTITLGGAVPNSRAFSSELSSGDTFIGTARKGAEYSTGKFTYTSGSPGSIAQTTVWRSSNGNAAVSFSAGSTGEVFIDPAGRLFDELNLEEITVASATTTDIGAVHGAKIVVSGTTTITGFGTSANKRRFVRFSGALTLTHNASSLILPGAANITTVAGDTAIFLSDSSGNWRCHLYQRADGAALSAVRYDAAQTLTATQQRVALANIGASLPPQGRLTLQSATPVMTTTQSGKTTLFYTPHVGNMIPIDGGGVVAPMVFTELSCATTDTTKNPSAIGANKMNDWFVWVRSGVLTLSHGPDWTNDTTRSAGTALIYSLGQYFNNVAIGDGSTTGPGQFLGTYVGTTRSDGSSQLNWILGASNTAGNLAVWNAYNRRRVVTKVSDTTATWSYTSATVRQARASANNQISFVSGLAEDGVLAFLLSMFNLLSATTAFADLGIALDSITVIESGVEPNRTNQSGTITNCASVVATYLPQLGYHYVAALEAGDGTNATVFIGSAKYQGLTLEVMM
jgi:hypothetical protein